MRKSPRTQTLQELIIRVFPLNCRCCSLLLILLAQPVMALDWQYRPGIDAELLPAQYRLASLRPGQQLSQYTPPEWMEGLAPTGGFSWQSLSIGPSSEAVDADEERTAVMLANQAIDENLSGQQVVPGTDQLPGALQIPLTLDLGIRYEF